MKLMTNTQLPNCIKFSLTLAALLLLTTTMVLVAFESRNNLGLNPNNQSVLVEVTPYYSYSLEAPTSLPNTISTPMSKSQVNSSLETEFGLPTGILAAVHQKETSGRCNVTSSAGAIGCHQFMPITIKDIKQRFNYEFDPTNYQQSAKAAAMKLQYLANRFQSNFNTSYEITWSLALAAYNAGYGNVVNNGWAKTAANYATSYRGVASIVKFTETSNYVRVIGKQLFQG